MQPQPGPLLPGPQSPAAPVGGGYGASGPAQHTGPAAPAIPPTPPGIPAARVAAARVRTGSEPQAEPDAPRPRKGLKDLPPQPPYGPVIPPRPEHLGRRNTAPLMTEGEPDTGITPGRIAAAVAGIVALLILGVGLGLWLTGDDPDEVAQQEEADSPFPAESEVFDGPQAPPPSQDFGQGELEPAPTRPEQNGGTGQPSPEPGTDGGAAPGAGGDGDDGGADPDDPSGELGEPPPVGGTQPQDGGTLPQEGGTQPQDGGTLPQDGGTQPQDGGTQPEDEQTQPQDGSGQGPFPDQPPPEDDGALDLPRLFDIPQPPPGADETSTRVSRTDDGTQTRSEQVTALDTDLGEVAVSADRHDDVAAQAEQAAEDAIGEIRLDSGATAYLLPGSRLVWLEPAGQDTGQDTLLEVDGPTASDSDDLIDIANAVEVRG